MGNSHLRIRFELRAYVLASGLLALSVVALSLLLTAGLAQAAAFVPAICQARVVDGNTYASADASAVQLAVDAAPAVATIQVAGTCEGITTVDGHDQTVYITQTVTLQGGYSPTDWTFDPELYPTTLDATDLGQVVYIIAPAGDIVLSDLILQGGQGGGIYNYSASLTINDSLIQLNHTKGSGGGIFNDFSALTLNHTVVQSNTADYDGGGIYSAVGGVGVNAPLACQSPAPQNGIFVGSVTLENGSALIGNYAGYDGGGLYGSGSLLMVDASLVQYNEAVNGGGIYNEGLQTCPLAAITSVEPFEGAQLTVSGGSLIDSNSAFGEEQCCTEAPEYIEGMGGGIFNYQATAIVLDSTLSNNVALIAGGGVGNLQGQLVLSATDVVSNGTFLLGGGIASTLGGFALTSPSGPTSPDCLVNQAEALVGPAFTAVVGGSQVRDNFAILYGGGVGNDNTQVLVDDSLVTGSQSFNGGGLYNHDAYCYGGGGDYEDFVAAMTIQNGSVVSGNRAGLDGLQPGLPQFANLSMPDPALVIGIGLGGGVFNGANSLAVYDSFVQENIAEDEGGGLASLGGYAVISSTQVLSNTALDGSGGGILIDYPYYVNAPDCLAATDGDYADLIVIDSTIGHNSADDAGGGVASWGPYMYLDGTTVEDNRAELGGGLFHEEIGCLSAPTGGEQADDYPAAITVVNGSAILANHASDSDDDSPDAPIVFSYVFNGGGIYSGNSSVRVLDSRIEANTAWDDGGGLYAEFSTVGVLSSSLEANTAVHAGGGLFAVFSDIAIGDSAVYNNAAGSGGGAALLDGRAVITNTTLSTNTAEDGFGGGLYLAEAQLGAASPDSAEDDAYLGNVTVANNTASESGQNLYSANEEYTLRNTIVAGSPAGNCDATVNTAGYNLEDGTSCGLSDPTDQAATNARLGPLADNGGGTLTHALLRDSPAIDTGACDLGHDQRGKPRPEMDGTLCDIGAFEIKLYTTWLPVVLNTKPDLVGSFTLSPNKASFGPGEAVTITVVVTNQGTAGTSSGFWVDFSLNPANTPAANLPWYDNCGMSPCQGLAWYVDVSLAPGESLTLTSTPGSYAPGHTTWSGAFTPGTTDVYLFVDSWNPTSATAAVAESDETNNLSELHGLMVDGAAASGQAAEAGRFDERWVLPAK